MVRYTVEEGVFLYKSYMKCGYAKMCRRIFGRKVLGITVLGPTGTHELI
jgi:hypothetical protein